MLPFLFPSAPSRHPQFSSVPTWISNSLLKVMRGVSLVAELPGKKKEKKDAFFPSSEELSLYASPYLEDAKEFFMNTYVSESAV